MEKNPEKMLEELMASITLNTHGNPLMAKIYAVIFSNPDDLALDEIAEESGYSLSSVSNIVRTLEKCEVVQRIKKPGSKKVYVRPQRDMFTMMRKKIRLMMQLNIAPIKAQMPPIIQAFKQKQKKLKNKDTIKKQIAICENHLSQMIKFEKAMQKMDEYITKAKEEK